MIKLADIFYSTANNSSRYSDELELKLESFQAQELYEQFSSSLNEEQKGMFEALNEIENHMQSVRESHIASKALALGIQIVSEAFCTNTNGEEE